jgi:hypothetical protein
MEKHTIADRLDSMALNGTYDEAALRIAVRDLRSGGHNGIATDLQAVMLGAVWDTMHIDMQHAANILRAGK